MRALSLELPDAEATAELGRALARTFPGAAGAGWVVHLCGDLGAGKTALARAFLQALGVPGPVRSPTYTLVETYACPETTFVHVDLYRLGSAAELAELGLRDHLRPGCVVLIEWPERGGSATPAADLTVRLDDSGAGRRADLASGSGAGETWLTLLASDRKLASYVSNLT